MEAQTESRSHHEIGVGAEFGPDKPRRVEQATHEEIKPLIITDKKVQSTMPEITKADLNSDEDDESLLVFALEGKCSPATSLSSINTDIPDAGT